MNTVVTIIFILIIAAVIVFIQANIFFILNRRIDEIHKSLAGIRTNNRKINADIHKRISNLAYKVYSSAKSDNEYTAVDDRDKRLHDLLKQFPMFKDNEIGNKEGDDNLYIICQDGTVLKYKDRIITTEKSSVNLKTLHASTTGEKRHMQLFDTLELLCNDKNFRSVYPVSEEDNNTLDVVMRDMSVRRYGFNRSYLPDGMIIEFYKYLGIIEDSQK